MTTPTWTLITGAAKRTGASMAKALAATGHNVVIHYLSSKNEALSLASKCRQHGVEAETIQGDFSTPKTTQTFIKNYLKAYPETSCLINNVGNYLVKSALNTTPQDWLDLFQTNLHAPFALCHALTPSLRKHQGNIVNLGYCGVDSLRADTHCSAYTLTKTALLGLTKSLALELAPDGVRVNMLSPGSLENSVEKPTQYPMGRPTTTEELCHALLFLLSTNAAHITGQNLEVNGALRL